MGVVPDGWFCTITVSVTIQDPLRPQLYSSSDIQCIRAMYMYVRMGNGLRKYEQLEAVSPAIDTPGLKCCNIPQGEIVGIYCIYNVIY